MRADAALLIEYLVEGPDGQRPRVHAPMALTRRGEKLEIYFRPIKLVENTFYLMELIDNKF